MTHFQFRRTQSSPKRLKRESPNFISNGIYQVLVYGWQTTPKLAWSGSRDSFFKILYRIISLELVKLDISNFVCWLMHRSTSACLIHYRRKVVCSEVQDVFKFWEISLSGNISITMQDRRRSYNGRLIVNRVWPIEWHQCQCSWMTLKVTFAELEFRLDLWH